MVEKEVVEILMKFQKALEKKGIRVTKIVLYGSHATGKFHQDSDIDVAIYLKEGVDLNKEKMNILQDLIDLLGTEEIDLVLLNTAPLTLKARIVENKKILVDKEPFLRHSFESLVLREYFDFSKKEEEIFKRRFLIGR